ncbi:MAG: hypothetical protein FJ029_15295, partial [Actinobacteria bacterium]|nr:hypothetical protein [Actinomycetota bacterium]
GQYFKDNFSGGAELPGRALQTEAFALEPGDQGISDDLPGSVKGIDKGFGTTGAAGLGFSAGHAFMNQTGLWWDREQFIWNLMTGGGLDPAQFPKIATDRNFRTNKEIVGLLQFTPAYAGGGLGEPQKFTPPKGLDKAWNDPGNTWGQFVNAIVASRTPAGGGSAASGLQIHAAAADVNPISRWIPWNEPDICLPKFPGYAWGGTRDQFAQLVAVAYEAILAANPKAKLIFPTLGLVEGVCNTPDDTHGLGAVISAGSAGSISAFFDHFVRWVKARPNQAAIAKLNHYFHCVSLALHDEPERVCEFVQHYRALLDREFPDDPAGKKCIMLVESTIEDYACDPADPTCSPKPGTAFGGKDRAHYIIQAFANALFAGADEVAMFNAASWWNDADARAGARTAVRFLSHITRGHPGRKKTPNICGPSAYNYRGIVRIDLPGPGFVATVFYNRDGRQRDLELTFTGSGGPIVGADPTGKEQTLPAGKSTVKLETSATCFTAYGTLFCFLGGGTRIYRYPDTMVLTTSALS